MVVRDGGDRGFHGISNQSITGKACILVVTINDSQFSVRGRRTTESDTHEEAYGD